MRYNLEEVLDKLKEDRDVVEPFAKRLMTRINAKPGLERVTMRDVTLKITITDYSDSVYRLLDDLVKESVGF